MNDEIHLQWPEAKKLVDFFSSHPLALKAAESIKSGRSLGLLLVRKSGPKYFKDILGEKDGLVLIFSKEKHGQQCRVVQNSELAIANLAKCDFIFQIPQHTAIELTEHTPESIAAIGLFIFNKIRSTEDSEKIRVRLTTSVLDVVMGGYLGVLSSGGPEIAKTLAASGLGSIGKMKDAIANLKKGD